MAVLQMKRISICALKKDRKAILELLQRRGIVEIDAAIPEDSVFSRTDTSGSRSVFQKNSDAAASALDVLNKYAPESKGLLSMLEGRTEKTAEDYNQFAARSTDVMGTVRRINAASRDVAENKAEILKLDGQLESLAPWSSLDLSMRTRGTRCTRAFFGTLGGDMDLESVLALLAGQNPKLPAVHVEVISTSQTQTCVFVLCHKDDAAAVEETLRAVGFATVANPGEDAPADQFRQLTERREELNTKIAEAEEMLRQSGDKREDVQFAVDYFNMRCEKYEMIENLAQSKHTFILTGYITEKDAEPLKAELEQNFDPAVEITDCDPKDLPPIALKNNGFTAPVEGVLTSFGYPGRGEVDPCSVMAIFYYVLFGLMLSDAAYGLLMAIGCGFALLKYKNMESGMRKTLKMYCFCGISTAFWGFMFGSFFGDVVHVVADTFFHRPDISLPALWFEPVKEPMRMLDFSMLLGLLHLFAGLAMKAYQYARQKAWLDILYDVVFWYLLLIGLVLFGLNSEMLIGILQLNFRLPDSAATVGLIMAAIGAVGILLTAGRESRSPFKRLLKGAYGLYGVTSYLSDILSYSRLLALGLATGVIATVVNSMGSMMGDGVVGIITFVLVFLVGHTLNLAINLLGAYVHTNRLQFVEFFGKFFEGGGREFRPFGVHTKYYKIK